MIINNFSGTHWLFGSKLLLLSYILRSDKLIIYTDSVLIFSYTSQLLDCGGIQEPSSLNLTVNDFLLKLFLHKLHVLHFLN